MVLWTEKYLSRFGIHARYDTVMVLEDMLGYHNTRRPLHPACFGAESIPTR